MKAWFDALPWLGLFVLLGLIIALFASRSENVDESRSGGRVMSEYDSVSAEINALEVKELIAQRTSADKTALEKQLSDLRLRLAKLEPAHEREMEAERQRQQEQARRAEQAQSEAAEKAEQKKAAEFQQACEDLKAKKISDLTVGDLDLLKRCGLPTPQFRTP